MARDMTNLVVLIIGLIISLVGAIAMVFPSITGKNKGLPQYGQAGLDYKKALGDLDEYVREQSRWVRRGAIILGIGFAIQIIGMWTWH